MVQPQTTSRRFLWTHEAWYYSESINHYSVLSTIEDMYGLQYTHNASQGMAITDTWQ